MQVGTLINPTNLHKWSFASLLKHAKLPKIVQETLGHANAAITLDTYSHVLPGMGDQAAEAMESALL